MKAIDIFCGAGGATLGMVQAGLDVVLSIDNWNDACQTHKINFPNIEILNKDIMQLDIDTLPKVDFIWGSPPCVDFSVANVKRDPSRGMILVNKFFEIVERLKPKWFVMENVKGVLEHIKDRPYKKVILDSANYGVPQNRKRLFVGNFNIPKPTHGPSNQINLYNQRLLPFKTVKDALGLNGTIGQPVRSLRLPTLKEIRENPFQDPDINPRKTDFPSPTITRKGLLFTDIFMLPTAHRNTGKNEPKVPRPIDRPSYTIDSRGIIIGIRGKGNKVKQFKEYRRLSVQECAILQGFPSDFVFYGSMSSQYKQVGNAVPPPLVKSIVEATIGGDNES